MPVKQGSQLTRDDVREALNIHRISISQVAKATGIQRPYVSEFLSGARLLKPEQLQAIREYLEGQGVEFDDAPSAAPASAPAAHPAIANMCHFPILAARVSEVAAVLGQMERNDKRIAELLSSEARRRSGMFEGNDYTTETVDAFSELYALMASNYLMFRYLTLEKNPLERMEGEQTVRSALVESMKEALESAGISTRPLEPPPAPEEEPAEEAAS